MCGLIRPWHVAPRPSDYPHFLRISIISYSVMGNISRQAMVAPMLLTGNCVKLPLDTCKFCPCSRSTEAKRSGQAERSGESGFGGLPRLRQSKSHARRRRPSRAQWPGRALRIWGPSLCASANKITNAFNLQLYKYKPHPAHPMLNIAQRSILVGTSHPPAATAIPIN